MTRVTFCPHVSLLPIQGPICMLLGAVRLVRVLLPFASSACVHEHHHGGFVLRDETQSDLLTPDHFSPITHIQSVSKTMCHFYNAWLYLFTQICIITQNK